MVYLNTLERFNWFKIYNLTQKYDIFIKMYVVGLWRRRNRY